MPNKLSQFWQELKRRRVIHVIVVYATAAFVIIELINNVFEPLGLPEGMPRLVIIILVIAFPIVIIFSWFYDVTPEGIKKTKPVHKVKKEDKPVSSKSWKIASYISFVVIVGLIVFNVISRGGRSKAIADLEKSIAVLPFIDDSPDKDNEHIINGLMDDLLIDLQSIKELKVLARTSVEQYRNNPKPVPEIAKELGVNYIVEGSGQKYGKIFKLRVQLLEGAKGMHLWGDDYEEEINKPEDYFRIQSQIAKSIAGELQAVITFEEKQLIDKIPTTSQTAHEFYQKGLEEHWKYWSDNNNKEALERAEYQYRNALEYDSTFAQAYLGLAWVYRDKQYLATYLTDNFLDSVLVLADIALSYDDQLFEAYVLRGRYYNENGNTEQAIEEFDKAIKLNPNDWMAYRENGWLYMYVDLVQSIANLHKAASLNRGPELSRLMSSIGSAYNYAGFLDKASHFFKESLKLHNDSGSYYRQLGRLEYQYYGNLEKSIEYFKKSYAKDSTNINLLNHLGHKYMLTGQYEEALYYLQKTTKSMAFETAPILQIHLGYVNWQMGNQQQAENYFNEVIEFYIRLHELARGGYTPSNSYYHLASVYAFKGEKHKAYECLSNWIQGRQTMPYYRIRRIKDNPLFNSIRDELEFQQIINDVEAKHQVEHERVRQWLEENEML